ncbi:MAG: HAMP domain-containing histidine kinase [Gammaproteobacteria bacterium]|nr:HAMP domain-containing histidine kinase [Gammaproteobacteria bacterium]
MRLLDYTMQLADYVESNKQRLIERWKQYAQKRLSLNLDESKLLNELPHLLDELVEALRSPSEDWRPSGVAARHARQRMSIGIDIGSLIKEIALVGETVVELAESDAERFETAEIALLLRGVSEAAAASASAYADMRNREAAQQAAQHFAFIAHEVRTPLQNARLAANLLASGPTTAFDEGREQLDRSLTRLSDLVDDALLGARLYAEPTLRVQPVEVRELIETAVGEASPRAQTRGVAIRTDVREFSIEADPKLIVSAVTNLLINAVDSCRNGRRIDVRARLAGDRAVIEVEDECGGIPEDLVPRLFQPFAQADDRPRSHKRGFGLGLMIVKQAAESHGGSVNFVNRPGVGCCFVLDLPRRRPDG